MRKKIALGTWSWGNKLLWDYNPTFDEELFKVYKEALKRGFSLIDTADSYGTGKLNARSEKLLGSFSKRISKGKLKKIKIATKLAPYPWRLGRKGLTRPYLNSLERLNKQLDVVQLHWSTARYNPLQEVQLLNNLCDLIDEGNTFQLGLSNIGPHRLKQLITFLEERGHKIHSVQVQFSLLSPDLQKQKKLQEVCKKNKINLLGYSPLAFGILCNDTYDFSKIKNSWLRNYIFNVYEKPSLKLRKCIKEIASRRSVSMAQVAINWCCYQGVIPIIGLRKVNQVIDVSNILKWDLNIKEFESLEYYSKEIKIKMPLNPFTSK